MPPPRNQCFILTAIVIYFIEFSESEEISYYFAAPLFLEATHASRIIDFIALYFILSFHYFRLCYGINTIKFSLSEISL